MTRGITMSTKITSRSRRDRSHIKRKAYAARTDQSVDKKQTRTVIQRTFQNGADSPVDPANWGANSTVQSNSGSQYSSANLTIKRELPNLTPLVRMLKDALFRF